MKNKALIVTNIIILVCIIIGLLIFMFWGIGTKHEFWNGESKMLKEENYDLDRIQKISTDVKSYDIFTKQSEDNNIKIEVYGSKKSINDIEISVDNQELKIKQVGSTFCFGFCFSNSKIVIYLPFNMNIATDFKTTSGDITIKTPFNHDTNSIKSTSGDIYLEYLKVGNVKTTSGDIKINEIKSGQVSSTSGDIEIQKSEILKVTTTSGEIEIKTLTNMGTLKSTSGDIEINSFTIYDNSNIETTSGDIDIRLNNDASIYTDTKSGDIHIKKSQGEYELNLKTTSGDITVK